MLTNQKLEFRPSARLTMPLKDEAPWQEVTIGHLDGGIYRIRAYRDGRPYIEVEAEEISDSGAWKPIPEDHPRNEARSIWGHRSGINPNNGLPFKAFPWET